ncbi:unnamed protein product [Effrenium voratum]|nr:unnamed protein product [Effrenium voratum]
MRRVSVRLPSGQLRPVQLEKEKPLQEQLEKICRLNNVSYDEDENFKVLVVKCWLAGLEFRVVLGSESDFEALPRRTTYHLCHGNEVAKLQLQHIAEAEDFRMLRVTLQVLLQSIKDNASFAEEVINQRGIEQLLEALCVWTPSEDSELSPAPNEGEVWELCALAVAELLHYELAEKVCQENESEIFRQEIFEVLVRLMLGGAKASWALTLLLLTYQPAPALRSLHGVCGNGGYQALVMAAAGDENEWLTGAATVLLKVLRAALQELPRDPLAQQVEQALEALECGLAPLPHAALQPLLEDLLGASFLCRCAQLQRAAFAEASNRLEGQAKHQANQEQRLRRLEDELRRAHLAMNKMLAFVDVGDHPVMVKSLQDIVRHGFENCPWPQNHTALHYAAQYMEDPRLLSLLCALASPEALAARDDTGRTAADYARAGQKPQLLRVLEGEVAPSKPPMASFLAPQPAQQPEPPISGPAVTQEQLYAAAKHCRGYLHKFPTSGIGFWTKAQKRFFALRGREERWELCYWESTEAFNDSQKEKGLVDMGRVVAVSNQVSGVGEAGVKLTYRDDTGNVRELIAVAKDSNQMPSASEAERWCQALQHFCMLLAKAPSGRRQQGGGGRPLPQTPEAQLWAKHFEKAQVQPARGPDASSFLGAAPSFHVSGEDQQDSIRRKTRGRTQSRKSMVPVKSRRSCDSEVDVEALDPNPPKDVRSEAPVHHIGSFASTLEKRFSIMDMYDGEWENVIGRQLSSSESEESEPAQPMSLMDFLEDVPDIDDASTQDRGGSNNRQGGQSGAVLGGDAGDGSGGQRGAVLGGAVGSGSGGGGRDGSDGAALGGGGSGGSGGSDGDGGSGGGGGLAGSGGRGGDGSGGQSGAALGGGGSGSDSLGSQGGAILGGAVGSGSGGGGGGLAGSGGRGGDGSGGQSGAALGGGGSGSDSLGSQGGAILGGAVGSGSGGGGGGLAGSGGRGGDGSGGQSGAALGGGGSGSDSLGGQGGAILGGAVGSGSGGGGGGLAGSGGVGGDSSGGHSGAALGGGGSGGQSGDTGPGGEVGHGLGPAGGDGGGLPISEGLPISPQTIESTSHKDSDSAGAQVQPGKGQQDGLPPASQASASAVGGEQHEESADKGEAVASGKAGKKGKKGKGKGPPPPAPVREPDEAKAESIPIDAGSAAPEAAPKAKGKSKGPPPPSPKAASAEADASGTKAKGKSKGPKGPKGPPLPGAGTAEAKPEGPKGPGKGPGKPGGKGPPAKGKGKKGKEEIKLRQPKIKPSQNMKQLWWTRFLIGRHIKEGETIWDAAGSEEVQLAVHVVENRFGRGGVQKVEKQEVKKQEKEPLKAIRIITDPNLIVGKEAALRKLPSAPAVASALEKLDSLVLGRDLLAVIQEHACPQPAQVSQLEECMKENPGVPLALPEQYMWKISRVPAFQARISCWSFVITYKESLASCSLMLSEFQVIESSLRSSEALKQLLALILAVGNYLNGSTERGQADGFDLETLTKLDSVKDNVVQSRDARHLIFELFFCGGQDMGQLALDEPSRCYDRGAQLMEDLAPLLKNVSRAVQRDSEGTLKMMKNVRVGLEEAEESLRNLSQQLAEQLEALQMALQFTEDPVDPLKLHMSSDLQAAKAEISALETQAKSCRENYNGLMKYFNHSGMKSSDFILLWDNLLIPEDVVLSIPLATLKKHILPRFCAPSVVPTFHDLLVLWGLCPPEQKPVRKGRTVRRVRRRMPSRPASDLASVVQSQRAVQRVANIWREHTRRPSAS